MTYNFSKSRGFAILYAVLMVSIVLSISLTLLDISYKQLILSSINKESKLAYYAAVSALSCVSYWDKGALPSGGSFYKPFGDFNVDTNPPTFIAATKPIYCAGNLINITTQNSGHHSSFQINFGGTSGPYAKVEVVKGDGTANALNYGTLLGDTLIRVDGYNSSSGSRVVQRSLDYQYR